MAGMGLGSLGAGPVGAGLGDDPTTTMRERQHMLESFAMLGGDIPPSEMPGATMDETSTEPEAMGRMGLVGYGLQRMGEGMAQGAADLVGDRLGSETGRDIGYAIGDFVGPSDEADAAYAARAEDRSLGGEIADAITTEAAPTAATIGASVLAGAAAGTATGVPFLGTLAGGAVGLGIGFLRMRDESRDKAKQYKAQQQYGEAVTQEQIDATQLSPDEVNKVDLAAGMSSALEGVTPLRVLGRLAPAAAQRLAKEAVLKQGVKGLAKKTGIDALLEGSTEVGQLAVQEMILNPELRERMSEGDVAETAKWVGQQYGREAAVSFAAGFGLGGAAGAPASVHEQNVTNAKRKNDIRVLASAGQNADVNIDEFENAARDPERVGQMAKDADEMRAAQVRLQRAEAERDTYLAKPEEERDPAITSELDTIYTRAKRNFDTKHDEVMPRYGGMKVGEVEDRRKQVEQEAKIGARDRAQANGFDVDSDAEPEAIHGVMEPLEQARADLDRAIRKRDTTIDETFRNKYSKQADAAKQKVRAAEINARKTLYGESPDEAAGALDREAGIRRHRERLFGSEEDPQATIDAADAVIAKQSDLEKVKSARQQTREKIARLYDERDNAETESKIAEIEAKISKAQAKLKQPDPLVEAATRAKRDAQKKLGIEPSAEELADPMAGVAVDEGALEAEVADDEAAPEGEVSTETSPTTSEDGDPNSFIGDPDQLMLDLGVTEAEASDIATASGTTPQEGGRESYTTEAGTILPEDHSRYFTEADDAITVPLSTLRPTRARGASAANAGGRMRQAFDNTGDKRAPISVRAEPDGTYSILDGNTTFANMRQAGWAEAPVRVVTNEQFAEESAPGFGRKTKTRARAKGDTVIARGPTARKDAAKELAERSGLKMRFEATDPEPLMKGDPRRKGPTVNRSPWKDTIDEVGPDADIDDVTEYMMTTDLPFEHHAAFNENGALLGFGTNSQENQVGLPGEAKGMRRGLAIHNHPVPTPFSAADINFLAGREADGFTMRVVTDGHVIEMRPTALMQASSPAEVSAYLAQKMAAIAASTPPGLDPMASARVRQEALLRTAEGDGYIDYTQPFSTLTDEEEAHVNTILDAVDEQAVADTGRDLGTGSDAGAGAAAAVQDGPAGEGGTGSAPDDASPPVTDQVAAFDQTPDGLRLRAEKQLDKRGPPKEARGSTYQGVVERFTVRNTRRSSPTKPLILNVTNEKNADAQSAALDVLHERHPNPLASEAAWIGYANDAFGTKRLAMPPFQSIKIVQENGAPIVTQLQGMTPGMVSDAVGGLATAQELGRLYADGEVSPADTASLFMWSFLSRGVSPYVQEGAFLDAVTSPVFHNMVDEAARGGWTPALAARYKAWASTIIPKGSPGRGTQHNLNAFGNSFMRVMSQMQPDGRTGLQTIHDMIADGAPSREIRRTFLRVGSGAGIDNKVVSFTLLLTGRDDVLVIDRIQLRNQFDDGRFNGDNIYDSDMGPNGKPVTGTAAADLTYGHKGLLYYEAMEDALRGPVDAAYAQLGRGPGSLGRYHWDSWLASSNQEVGHASVEGLVRTISGDPQGMTGTFVKQGKFGAYDYGFRYTVMPDASRATIVDTPSGVSYNVPLSALGTGKPLHRDFTKLKAAARKADPAAGDAYPWVEGLNATQKEAYSNAVKLQGTPATYDVANATDAVGRAPDGEPTPRPDARGDGSPAAGRARGGSRRNADGSLKALEGSPKVRGHQGPIQDLVKVAERYAESIGLELVPQAEFVDVDEARAKRIADAYEAMPHAPQDPVVAEAYQNLIQQTRAQYDALVDAGYEFGFFAPDSPYGSSPATAMEDIRLNKRMLVFPTADGFGTSPMDVNDNPMLADTGLTWPDENGDQQPVYANDLFRAVHDAFGHGLEGAGFRAKGEENAWQAHIRLFTGSAKGAITSETRGQNSWLNYGPHAATNQTAAVEDTFFADQKTGLMPEWTWTEGIAPDAPETSDTVAAADIPMVPGEPAPLYVRRDVTNDGGLRAWAEKAGIKGLLSPEKLHSTITYSYAPVDVANAPAKTNTPVAKATGEVVMLGGTGGHLKSLAMKVTKGALGMDHNRYRKAGASHDYDDYTPHVTLKYNATDEDLAKLQAAKPFKGTIQYGPEVQSRAKDRPDPDGPGGGQTIDTVASTDSPEFKAWFGDSVVVNPDGSPKEVYHGTDRLFAAFDPSAKSSTGVVSRGMFVTDNPRVAAGYGGTTLPLYAKIEAPVTLDFGGKSRVWFDGANRSPSELVNHIASINDDLGIGAFDVEGDLREELEAAGWDYMFSDAIDGVVMTNVSDSMDMFGGEVATHYAVFKPNQIKSVDNRGTWSPDTDDIVQAVTMPNYLDIGYKDTKASMQGMIDVAKNPKTAIGRAIDTIEDKFFNGFAPIRRLEVDVTGKLAEGAESAYKAAEMAVNDSGRQEALLYYGAAKLGPHGEFTVATNTKGLREIFDTAAQDDPQNLADWMSVMAAKRARDLHARGIRTPLTEADIAAALAKDTPAFRQASADWKAHNDANVDFLVDTGRITRAQADVMKAEQHYVPFYRSDSKMADGTSPDFSLDEYLGNTHGGRAGSGAVLKRDPGIKKIVGGDKKAIDNLMLNMIRNSQAMVAAGMRNDAANKSFDLMEMAGLAHTIKATKTGKSGRIVRREKPANSVRMWIGGKEKFVVVEEDGAPLVAALGGLHPRQRGAVEQIMIQIAAVFRQGITITPAFMIRNAIRGAVSTGIMTSGANLTASNNAFTGFVDALRKGDATKAFKHTTGMGDYRFGSEDAGFGQNDILIEYGLAPKTVMSRLRSGLNAAEKVGTATELADRVAAYKTWVANGVRPDEAAYQALTIMNYGRRGNSGVVQVMAPMVPFLNARLQGLSRMMEGAVGKRGAVGRREAMMRLVLNGAVLSTASLALWAWNNDDEEKREKYLAEPLFRRLNYHPIYAGDRTFYIPKAFELGAIFSSVPEVFADAMFNDMGDQVMPATKSILAQTFLFNAIPAAMLPSIEAMTNHSFFRDGPIETARESAMLPRDRTTGASPLAIAVGQKLGVSDATKVSPAMIEHYMQGYGGAYYHMMSAAFEMVGAELGLIPSTPEGALGDTPVASAAAERALGSLVKAQPLQTERYVEEFYTAQRHIQQIYMSAKAAATNGDVDYARSLLAQAPGLEGARKIMNKAGPKMGDINDAIRIVRMDKTLSRQQKAAKLQPLIKARNDLSRVIVGVIRQIEDQQGSTFARVS